jgi:MOSC domain-containing protein YiiM
MFVMTHELRRLLSVQVGQPRTRPLEDGTWRSAIYKSPVGERVFLDFTNVTGDRQANTRHHGGPEKAVCCFPAEHYSFWRETLHRNEGDFGFGAFGENFTLVGMTEETVCVGDVYAVGTARVQVCQPRIPCMNLVHKWGYKEMPALMQERNQTGYYLRVLETGEVGAGDDIAFCDRTSNITIATINDALYRNEGGPEFAATLARLPELAAAGRRIFRRFASKNKT